MILTKINLPTTICSLLLLSTGILVISTSSQDLALQQLIFALIGTAAFLFVSYFDYRSIKNLIIPLYISILLLLVLLSFLGVETRGSIRWIPLGFFNIQPSEFTKPILILVLAFFWSKNFPNWKNILISFLWALPLILLIFRQPDLGSALTLGAVWFGMLVASQVSFKKIVVLAAVAMLIIPMGWLSLHDYQRQRITSFLAPHSDPLGRGYNLIQSTIAVGSGQFLGRGLGRGTQSRLQFLPEFRTDFIFASIAEEMGFIGSVIILSIYLFLITYFLKLSEKTFDLFGHLIVFGVMSMLLFQTTVNIGMNIGLIPITGITLPLISYGGSSLVATLISLGLVASVARFKRRVYPD
ncbi:rod shape-determining protein RodA [Candidatus Microgenomates bacterium]|nr:rod shape-determining protein RodA [Candidatus Microgenomates bacterium]